jgi:hypothetical protein
LSVTSTVLIYFGIPVLIVLVIAALTFAGGARSAPRYRPGRPFEFTPVWFLSSPEELAKRTGAAALPAGTPPAALAGGEARMPAAADGTGGASDRW